MKKRRDHIIELLYHLYDNIKNFIIPITTIVISLFSIDSKFKPYIAAAFILFSIILAIRSFLTWYNKTYTIKEKMIEFSDGVFKKKRADIPIHNIRSVNTTDSLIKRIIGISNLNIELIGGDEVYFVLSNRKIKELKENIFSITEYHKNRFTKTKFCFREYVLITTTSFRLFLTSLSLVLTAFSYLLTHFSVQLGIATQQEIAQAQNDTRGMFEKVAEIDWTDKSFYITIGIFFIIVILISFFVTYILVYLTYRNFKIQSTENEIGIMYGLLSKKNFHISRSNIRTIRIIEPFWYRMFGYVSIKADNIGLDDNVSKSLFIMPIVKKEQINSLINDYTPDFKNEKIEFSPQIQVLPIFIFKSVFWVFVILTVLSFVSKYVLWGYLLLPICMMFGYMKWRYSGLTFTSKFITHSYSSGLTKITLITKKKYIESTGVKQTLLQKRRNAADYEYAVYSERLIEVYECSSLSFNQKKNFLQYLKKQ